MHDINFGGTYSLDVGALSISSGFTANVNTAIQYLFGTNNNGNLKPVPPGGIGGTSTALDDGNFQAALWATIYDYSGLLALGSAPSSLSGLALNIMNSSGVAINTSTVATMAWDAVHSQGVQRHIVKRQCF